MAPLPREQVPLTTPNVFLVFRGVAGNPCFVAERFARQPENRGIAGGVWGRVLTSNAAALLLISANAARPSARLRSWRGT